MVTGLLNDRGLQAVMAISPSQHYLIKQYYLCVTYFLLCVCCMQIRFVTGQFQNCKQLPKRPRLYRSLWYRRYEVTTVADHGQYSLGGYGGVLLNHRLLLGGLGKMVFFRPNNQPRTFVYFGLYTEYHFNPARLVHLSVGVMGGMGVLSNRADNHGNLIFVTEPRASLHVNVTNFYADFSTTQPKVISRDKFKVQIFDLHV